MGHTAVSDFKTSSVTLITWRKEPEENTIIPLIVTGQSTDAKTATNKIETKNSNMFRI